MALFSLCKHQLVTELYSVCFVTSGSREIIIFVKDGSAHEIGIKMINFIILITPFKKQKQACIDIGSRNRHLFYEECIFSTIALLFSH